MTKKVIAVATNENLHMILRLMADTELSRVTLIRNLKPVEIITGHDLLPLSVLFGTRTAGKYWTTQQEMISRRRNILKVRNHLPKWESPIFTQGISVADSSDKYYIVVAFLDLFEFLFGLNKRDMIDTEIWSHWKALAETIMTIPKFKSVWEKTKDVHALIFRLLKERFLTLPLSLFCFSVVVVLAHGFQNILYQ